MKADSAFFDLAAGGMEGDFERVVGKLKPGAHLLALSTIATHHSNTIGIEDAGMEIRDTVVWVFDSGEPTPEMLMVTVARKPLEGTVAENTLKYGTGGLNIDGCRVELNGDYKCKANGRPSQTGLSDNYDPFNANQPDTQGRWPANLIHDGGPITLAMFPDSKGQQSSVTGKEPSRKTDAVYGKFKNRPATEPRGDIGSAARFFYSAPHLDDLLKYLLKLITPPGGTVLTNCDNILVQSAYPSVRYCEN